MGQWFLDIVVLLFLIELVYQHIIYVPWHIWPLLVRKHGITLNNSTRHAFDIIKNAKGTGELLIEWHDNRSSTPILAEHDELNGNVHRPQNTCGWVSYTPNRSQRCRDEFWFHTPSRLNQNFPNLVQMHKVPYDTNYKVMLQGLLLFQGRHFIITMCRGAKL